MGSIRGRRCCSPTVEASTRWACASRSMSWHSIGGGGRSASGRCSPGASRCLDGALGTSLRSPQGKDRRSAHLSPEVPLSMLSAAPVLGEPQHEDTVEVHSDGIAGVAGDDDPMHRPRHLRRAPGAPIPSRPPGRSRPSTDERCPRGLARAAWTGSTTYTASGGEQLGDLDRIVRDTRRAGMPPSTWQRPSDPQDHPTSRPMNG